MDAKMLIVTAVMSVGLFGNAELPSELKESLPAMIVYRYKKMVESHKSVQPNDPEHKLISAFLHDNKDGWELDARSYSPNIVFKGPTYSINCMSDGVVINYRNKKGKWTQISKSIKTPPFCGLPQE